MSFAAVVACWAACIRSVPWWVWIVLPLAGAMIGALTYLAGILLAGGGAIIVNLLLKAILWGALCWSVVTVRLLYARMRLEAVIHLEDLC
jgi:hypothetical protein